LPGLLSKFSFDLSVAFSNSLRLTERLYMYFIYTYIRRFKMYILSCLLTYLFDDIVKTCSQHMTELN